MHPHIHALLIAIGTQDIDGIQAQVDLLRREGLLALLQQEYSLSDYKTLFSSIQQSGRTASFSYPSGLERFSPLCCLISPIESFLNEQIRIQDLRIVYLEEKYRTIIKSLLPFCAPDIDIPFVAQEILKSSIKKLAKLLIHFGEGSSWLHCVLMEDNPTLLLLFIQSGFSPMSKNGQGNTVIELFDCFKPGLENAAAIEVIFMGYRPAEEASRSLVFSASSAAASGPAQPEAPQEEGLRRSGRLSTRKVRFSLNADV